MNSDKAINYIEELFLDSLKEALSDYLSEQQFNQITEDFKDPFDRLRATMRRNCATLFTKGLGQRSIHGE